MKLMYGVYSVKYSFELGLTVKESRFAQPVEKTIEFRYSINVHFKPLVVLGFSEERCQQSLLNAYLGRSSVGIPS